PARPQVPAGRLVQALARRRAWRQPVSFLLALPRLALVEHPTLAMTPFCMQACSRLPRRDWHWRLPSLDAGLTPQSVPMRPREPENLGCEASSPLAYVGG